MKLICFISKETKICLLFLEKKTTCYIAKIFQNNKENAIKICLLFLEKKKKKHVILLKLQNNKENALNLKIKANKIFPIKIKTI